MKITIDPRFRINYASFYIKGLWDAVGVNNVKFDSKPFLKDNLYSDIIDYNKCIIFILENGDYKKRVIIDFDDSDKISLKHYNWSDVYAKINIKENDLSKYKKTIAIGPSFGINLININTIVILIKVLFIKHKPVNNLIYLKNYFYMQIRRMPYKSYLKSKSENDYIFAISTLWYDPLTYKTTNKFRLVFFESCKRIFKKVEGGFFYIKGESILRQFPQYIEYKNSYNNLLYTQRVSPKEYLKKTNKSALVFNTPSVSGCHGWKLAEYFAMGKAIISTPLNNVMPDGFCEGENIIIVDNEIELESAIRKIHSDKKLIKKLENNSYEYFNNVLSPSAVINKIIQTAFKN